MTPLLNPSSTPATPSPRVETLVPGDALALARLHLEAFPSSAITRLGQEAARRYYSWQFEAPHKAAFLGVRSGAELAGFCICGVFRGALSGFLRRNRVHLAWTLLSQPWLLFHSEIRRALTNSIAGRLRSMPSEPATASRAAPGFGILAIAVSPRHQRMGIGLALMSTAEEIARARGHVSMGLTVSPHNSPAVRFYESLGWVRQLEEGNRWTGRMRKAIAMPALPST